MKIGITGTRSGMREAQREQFYLWLWENAPQIEEFHHGDCVGVDVEAAELVAKIGIKTVCHPPVDESLRAFHKSDVILPQLTHFARNRAIVDSTDMLIVVPWELSWQPKGGTWYTASYATKIGKPFKIFYETRGLY